MARATSSLPVPVSPSTSTVASVGATISTCPMTRLSAALVPTISSYSCDAPGSSAIFLGALPRGQILHKGDPSKGRRGQNGAGDQNAHPGFILANVFHLKWCARSLQQAFFIGAFMQRQDSGATTSAHCKPSAMKSSRLYPIMLRKASLASTMRSNSPETMPAMVGSAGSCRERGSLVQPCFFDAVTGAEVAHHPHKTQQFLVPVSAPRWSIRSPRTGTRPFSYANLHFQDDPRARSFLILRASVDAKLVVIQVQAADMLADGFFALVAVHALRARVPGNDQPAGIQGQECEIGAIGCIRRCARDIGVLRITT